MQPFYRFDHFSKEKSLIHAVSKKEQTEAYAFSLALHTGEKREDILANRKHLIQKLSVARETVWVVANQTHSDHVAVIDKREMRGWEYLEDAVEDCDALVTDQEDMMLTILTADCVPVLLFDPVRRVVAAVHAGWRGTEAEIVSKTIKVMKERFGSEPSDMIAGVGPAIGKCCYEVGEDVTSHFAAYPEALEQHGEKSQLDLPEINRRQMIAAGLSETHIEMSAICTACDVDHFFSYRKEQGCSGRFMSVIGLAASSAELTYHPSAIPMM
ncbi:MAG TPA: peptidoglycan editing factor PgeF [Epsilonproteobacteria bacterium]|nr:peptidoglycan editing factor PgeF [Campylobacterota bacterium]